jgi:thioredoxin 1
MALTHLNKADFDQAVNAGDDLVVVDFFATWCGPCKMLAPAVERAAGQHPEVHFYKVDIDEEPDLANRFQIMSVPTLLFIKRGQVISKTVGVISSQELEKEIENGK